MRLSRNNPAGHAAQLGRTLGAVPGPVTSAASAGCHRLIREFDAVCVTSAAEMAELAPLDDTLFGAGVPGNGVTGDDREAERPSVEVRLLDALSPRSPRTTHDVASRSGLSMADAQAILGRLDLAGEVIQRERGWVKR